MTLENWLEKEDITNAELARRLHTSRQAVHSWVTGQQVPGLYWAHMLAAATDGAVPTETWLTPDQAVTLQALRATYE